MLLFLKLRSKDLPKILSNILIYGNYSFFYTGVKERSRSLGVSNCESKVVLHVRKEPYSNEGINVFGLISLMSWAL